MLEIKSDMWFELDQIASSGSQTTTQKGALFSVGLAGYEFTKMPLLLSKNKIGL